MLEHTKHQAHKKFYNMRCLVMFITAVCLLLLLKLKWPKNKSVYDTVFNFWTFRVDRDAYSRLALIRG